VIDVNRLPASLRERDGIPPTSGLQEWTPAGGELLLAGEALLEPDGLNFKMKFHLFDLVEQKHIVGKTVRRPLTNPSLGSPQNGGRNRSSTHRGEGGSQYQDRLCVLQGTGKEIFISDFDGSNVKQITQNRSSTFRRPGLRMVKRIAFTSYLRRNPDLYLIDLDGKNFQLFSRYPRTERLSLLVPRRGKRSP